MTRRLPPPLGAETLVAATAATGAAGADGDDEDGEDLAAAAGGLMTQFSLTTGSAVYLTQLRVALGSIRRYKSNW
jgi:hypothetical protein